MKTSPANQVPKCFANCHMTPKEFGVWNYLRSVSHESGIAYLSGDQIAECFANTCGDAIYDTINRLKSKGWIEIFSPSYRNNHGVWVARGGIVLDHAKWVEKFGPGDCRPVGKSLQVADTNLSANPDLSGNNTSPVAKSLHSCRETANNIEVDFEVDSERVVVGEGTTPPRSLLGQNLSGNERAQLLSDMREIYDYHNLSGWNTKPADELKIANLYRQHGRRLFLQAFDTWCHNDAYDQIETQYGDPLKFPIAKFLNQISTYLRLSQDTCEVKRRAKDPSGTRLPFASPFVREPLLEVVK
jgi:hypothetical protein